jgi:hypothetical protein
MSIGRSFVTWKSWGAVIERLRPGQISIRKYQVAPRRGTQVVRRRLLLRLYSDLGPVAAADA